MSSRSALMLVVGFVLGGLLVACGTRRGPDISATAHGQPGEATAVAPPGLKKGAKVYFEAVANHPGGFPAFTYWADVVEVKGNWALLKFTPTEAAAKNGRKVKQVWVNFNTVVWYEVE
jgi:hypothetical protein